MGHSSFTVWYNYSVNLDNYQIINFSVELLLSRCPYYDDWDALVGQRPEISNYGIGADTGNLFIGDNIYAGRAEDLQEEQEREHDDPFYDSEEDIIDLERPDTPQQNPTQSSRATEAPGSENRLRLDSRVSRKRKARDSGSTLADALIAVKKLDVEISDRDREARWLQFKEEKDEVRIYREQKESRLMREHEERISLARQQHEEVLARMELRSKEIEAQLRLSSR